jgi:hypothetical protein
MVLYAKSGGQRPPVSTQQRTAKGPVNLERVTRDCKCGESQTSAIHCLSPSRAETEASSLLVPNGGRGRLSLPRGDGSFLSGSFPMVAAVASPWRALPPSPRAPCSSSSAPSPWLALRPAAARVYFSARRNSFVVAMAAVRPSSTPAHLLGRDTPPPPQLLLRGARLYA